jgi:hypothetical protein
MWPGGLVSTLDLLIGLMDEHAWLSPNELYERYVQMATACNSRPDSFINFYNLFDQLQVKRLAEWRYRPVGGLRESEWRLTVKKPKALEPLEIPDARPVPGFPSGYVKRK